MYSHQIGRVIFRDYFTEMLVLNMHNDIGQNGHAQHMGECWVATLILGVERGIPGL